MKYYQLQYKKSRLSLAVTIMFALMIALSCGGGGSSGNVDRDGDLDSVVSINVTEPTAGAQWQRGTTHTIRWTTSGTVGNVQLQLRDSSGNYSMINESVANTGSYDWTIPASIAIGSGFQIRVSDVDRLGSIYDHSDSFSFDSATSGELYIGYYAEDPRTNPEDPSEGALFLNLPRDGNAFSGAFSFTYTGCQSSNVGLIAGNKSASSLDGQWSGFVDGSPQSGFFEGRAGSGASAYAGTYTVSGGKQFIIVPGCISYYIAPNGSWELFLVGETYSAAGNDLGPVEFIEHEALWHNIAWTSSEYSARSLVFIIDIDLALADTGKAIVWQSTLPGHARRAYVPYDAVSAGRCYVAGVALTDGVTIHYFSTTQFAIGQQKES